MSNPLIVANWKMNPQTEKEAEDLAVASDKKGVVICPPFVFLKAVKKVIKKAEVGAQNCFSEKKGPFTGEVSPLMLKNFGCKYVIIGHSERRGFFAEGNEVVNKKVKAVLGEGLTPIMCVGERGEDEDDVETIRKQLVEGLKEISLKRVVVAYEPVFAIGTGNPCDVDEAEKKKVFIKSVLSKTYQNGESVPVLYGGSVDVRNALTYVREAGFQGLLVGGASLKPKEFEKIIKSVA